MKAQSADTHPETERMLIHLIRSAPVSKRFQLIQSLTQGAFWSNMHAWQQRHPNISEQEAAIQALSRYYGPVLATRVHTELAQRKDWHLQPTDLLTAMLPALHTFDEHHLFCYLGGSIASSLHGMQQMAHDIDIVVDLHNYDLSSLLPRLKHHYVLDENAFLEAVRQQIAYSLIHLDTLMKVDLVVAKREAFDTALRQHVVSSQLDERYPPLLIASTEEMILVKARRYSQDLLSRTDGMRDDAEWNDIVGMLKVQEPTLERKRLDDWARILQITETLGQALVDAGIEQEKAA